MRMACGIRSVSSKMKGCCFRSLARSRFPHRSSASVFKLAVFRLGPPASQECTRCHRLSGQVWLERDSQYAKPWRGAGTSNNLKVIALLLCDGEKRQDLGTCIPPPWPSSTEAFRHQPWQEILRSPVALVHMPMRRCLAGKGAQYQPTWQGPQQDDPFDSPCAGTSINVLSSGKLVSFLLIVLGALRWQDDQSGMQLLQ
jgi:hypothetical protein